MRLPGTRCSNVSLTTGWIHCVVDLIFRNAAGTAKVKIWYFAASVSVDVRGKSFWPVHVKFGLWLERLPKNVQKWLDIKSDQRKKTMYSHSTAMSRKDKCFIGTANALRMIHRLISNFATIFCDKGRLLCPVLRCKCNTSDLRHLAY